LLSEASTLDSLADQVDEAWIMAAIHFQSDVAAGKALRQLVADVIWARAGQSRTRAPIVYVRGARGRESNQTPHS
jgi:hypothetical protein